MTRNLTPHDVIDRLTERTLIRAGDILDRYARILERAGKSY